MPEKELEKTLKIQSEKLEGMGVFLKKEFTDTEAQRLLYREDEWLESLRQYKGIYDPEVLSKIQTGKSTVYPRYTRSKVNPAIAKLNNLLFPDNDRNWEIKPTPQPELDKAQIDDIVAAIEVGVEEGQALEITDQEIDDAIMSYSKGTAEEMTTTMDDQLTEDGYTVKAKNMIKTSVMLGTGVLKGPLSKSEISRKLVKNDDGSYSQKESKKFRPFVESMSLWRWFPDMSSTELEHCNFVFELHSMTKHELRKLSRRKGFKGDVITEYVRNHRKGDYKLRNWEIDLKTIKDEENVQKSTNNYEVLEYNGYLDGQDLFEAGVITDKKKADQDHFVNIWLLGNKIIKAIIHPIESLTELYHVFYFEKDESSIFGEGLPRVLRDTQISICSATRAMLDNAAWVAGPIIEVNSDLLPDEETDDMYPGRVLEREGRGVDAQYPALRVYDIKSRMTEYLAIIEKFERNGDMESTLPRFMSGEAAKTTNETTRGISIRASNTNLTINDIVKSFDEANESFLRALYSWNMEHNPDKNIKGDMKVKAIGSESLVSKEERTSALDFFAQGLQPEDKPYVKRLPLLDARFKLHDLDPERFLYTEEEAQANIERAQDSEAVELQKMNLMADGRYTNAKALNMESKSEATLQGISMKELETVSAVLEKIKGGRRGEGKQTGEGEPDSAAQG